MRPREGRPTTPRLAASIAEYYFQRALLLLGQNKKSEALPYLTLYVQTGKNPKQVDRALELIVDLSVAAKEGA